MSSRKMLLLQQLPKSVLLFSFLCSFRSGRVDGFLPTTNPMATAVVADAPESFTHQDIITNAVRTVAKGIIVRQKAHYPDAKNTLLSNSFKEALQQFRAAVARPDAEEADRPEAHFHGESFSASTARIIDFRQSVVTSIKTSAIKNAREFAARALHGLQDFYSHSNWIELGNLQPYPDLGLAHIPPEQIAKPDQETCVECEPEGGVPADVGVCRNNIVESGLLTSGYYESTRLGSKNAKPKGKCSHGGRDDATALLSPVGGINKDTANEKISPHNYMHATAATVAEQSTIDFLESIRAAVIKDKFDTFEDEAFAEFLGIPVGSATTLCFVVDTTGSMGDEIVAVRDQTIRMTQDASASTGAPKPSDYVLSPFNDPGFGPVVKTTNADEMIRALQGLRADGGGDEPEMAFSGIQLALQNVRIGSTCYFFTDASAKDTNLFPVVKSLALTKKVKIITMITTVTGKKKRSASRRRRSVYPYYDELSQSTGGLVMSIANRDIQQAVKIVNIGARASQVTVFSAENVVANFSFFVDNSMSDVVLQLSSSSPSLQAVSVTTPTGSAYTSYTRIMDMTSMKVYNLSTLVAGQWGVSVSSGGQPFSAVVTAVSEVSFTYQFATIQEDDLDRGFQDVIGNPIAGTSYYILTDVYGTFDPITDESTGALSNVSAILLVNQAGIVLSRLPASALRTFRQYQASSVLPSAGFRVALEGRDSAGNVVQRFDQSVMTAVVVKLEITVEGNGSYSVYPGTSVNVIVNVTNVGDATSWYIRVSDTANFYIGSGATVISLNKGETKSQTLRFSVPPSATYGLVSTVTVSAGTSSAVSVQNYRVFYINVKSASVDTNQPTCKVERVDGVCGGQTADCSTTSWSVYFSMSDVGTGLKTVKVKSLMTQYNYSLQVDRFKEGSNATVSGIYQSTCCYPNVTLFATDLSGNVGSCFVYNDPTPPTCTLVHTEGTCRAAYTNRKRPCQSEIWQAIFRASDVGGSGLKQVVPDLQYTNGSLTTSKDEYSPGVIVGTFRSSCCQQTASIVLKDAAGNTGRCDLVAGSARGMSASGSLSALILLSIAVMYFVGH